MDSSISSTDEERLESVRSLLQTDLSSLTASQLHSLEVAYQVATRNTEFIIKDEGARRLRLRILLLENENDDLHEQLALADERVDALEQEGDELQAELDSTREDSQQREVELRSQARELNNLKVRRHCSNYMVIANRLQAELNSVNGVTMDSTKVLTEKLALARELATLKPELDHLRSQAAYQQTVLSDKLALQRQVSTLEVELETEKRASKRASEKNKNKEKELELQQQLDDTQKELAREKREREKARKEAEKELVAERASKRTTGKGSSGNEGTPDLQQELEALQGLLDNERREREKARSHAQKELDASETQNTLLEGKLDHIRTKMRATKEQLKECQAELEEARAAKGPSMLARGDMTAKSARKRSALEMSTDVSIGTPDGGAVRGKKRGKVDQTMPGEKSAFSITPYLNRTIGITQDSPAQESGDEPAKGKNGASATAEDSQELEGQLSDAISDANSPSVQSKSKLKRKTIPKEPAEKKTLGEASTGTSNRKRDPKASRSISSLEMVTEEDDDDNEEPTISPATTKVGVEREVVKTSKVQLKSAEETTEPKKKKRKLLGAGKTLFDEVDGGSTKRSAKVALGPSKSKPLGKGGVAGPKGAVRGGLGAISGFGTFSPLKKDRKASGASFLA
jgi:hypothetical protein